MARQLRLDRSRCIAAAVGVVAPFAASEASVTVYPQDLAGFDLAASSPPVALNFDAIPAGTAVGGLAFAGVTLVESGAPLKVVAGADTFTPGGFSGAPNPRSNKLFPTSGANVLSPGGLELAPGFNPALEDDDLTLVFDPPVAAFGFSHLSQSADGFGFTSVTVRNPENAVLFSGSVPISNLGGGGAPGGADFWGIVSTAADIATITFDEGDGNAQFPDCNIGFDSFRFVPTKSCGGDPDLDGDGDVDAADLAGVLAAWGTDQCAPDLDGDGQVDAADLTILLAAWTT